MVRDKRDRRSRRRQFELQCLDNIIRSIREQTAHGLNMQAYTQERLEYGIDPKTAAAEGCEPLETDKRSGLSDADVLSVPLSASLYGDYSYIYDEYLD